MFDSQKLCPDYKFWLKCAKSLTTRPAMIKIVCEILLNNKKCSHQERVISTLNLFEKVCNKIYRKIVHTKYYQLKQRKILYVVIETKKVFINMRSNNEKCLSVWVNLFCIIFIVLNNLSLKLWHIFFWKFMYQLVETKIRSGKETFRRFRILYNYY